MNCVPGDKVTVLSYPNHPIGIIVRRCKRDNRFLYVDVEGRGRQRIREKNLKKIRVV